MAIAINLNDDLIKAITSKSEHRDSECGGLSIVAGKRGTPKNWRLRTRLYVDGKPTPIQKNIGGWPNLKVDGARKKATEYKALAKQGIDPWAQAVNDEPKDRSFEAIVKSCLYILQYKKKNPIKATTLNNYERAFRRHMKPLYKRTMEEITTKDLNVLMEQIAAKVSKGEANKVMTIACRFWNVALANEFVSGNFNPALLVEHYKITPVLSVLGDDSHFKRFFEVIDQLASPQMTNLFTLYLLTGIRNGAVRAGRWEEIDWDSKIWTIPASRMKGRKGMEREYILPLTDTLIALLKKQQRYVKSLGDPRRRESGLIFPALRDNSKDGAVVVRRSDQNKLNRLLGQSCTPHTCRRSMRTLMESDAIDPVNQQSIRKEVIDALMAHTKKGLDVHYNHYQYLREKRHALELYHSYLEQLVGRPLITPINFGPGIDHVTKQAVIQSNLAGRAISKLHPTKQKYVRQLMKVRYLQKHSDLTPANIARTVGMSETVCRRMCAGDLAVWFVKWESEYLQGGK